MTRNLCAKVNRANRPNVVLYSLRSANRRAAKRPPLGRWTTIRSTSPSTQPVYETDGIVTVLAVP
ncbi:hypothetical protein BPODLACK_01683 [Gordonia sp. YY1]|nr:hypothetical protein BPODLACK_01683 [Gordonia sp. YY1]